MLVACGSASRIDLLDTERQWRLNEDQLAQAVSSMMQDYIALQSTHRRRAAGPRAAKLPGAMLAFLRQRLLPVAILVLSALGAVACQMQRPIARGMPWGSSTVCVFGVRGVRAVTRETDDGMDVILTVVGDEGDGIELRRNAHAALAGDFHVRPEARAIMQQVTSTLYDRPDGLTIHAKPIDPTMLEQVRHEIRHVIEEATSDRCD